MEQSIAGDTPVSVRRDLTRTSLKKEELHFDRERARELLGVLYRTFTRDESHRDVIMQLAPQWAYRPSGLKECSLDLYRWLWFAGSTDLREDSGTVYRSHQMLWENARGILPFREINTRLLYHPEVLDWDQAQMTWALAKCRFGNPRRNIEWWQRRAHTLWNVWGGDPRKMYQSGSIDGFLSWKDRSEQDPVPGVGPKIASLIAIFFEELGMEKVPDAFPVDVHVQSLALSLKLITSKRAGAILNETLEEVLRKELIQLCREEGWDRITLSHAMWFLGNRGCRECAKTPHMRQFCPVWDQCVGRYDTKPYFRMGLWLPYLPPRLKGGEKRIAIEPMPLFE